MIRPSGSSFELIFISFRKRYRTHQSSEKPFNRVHSFQVSPYNGLVSQRLQSLLVTVRFPASINDLVNALLRYFSQDCPSRMGLTHQPCNTNKCCDHSNLDLLVHIYAIYDNEMNSGQSSFFQLVKETGPAGLVLAVGNPYPKDLAILIVTDTGRHQMCLRDIPENFSGFVTRGIDEQMRKRLFEGTVQKRYNLFFEVLGDPRGRGG